jgi:hypothetical protein
MKIRSPKSKKLINIDGVAYNKLITSGEYTEKYLLSLPKIDVNSNVEEKVKHYSNVSGNASMMEKMIVPEVLIKVMLETGYPDFMNFCKVNKYLQDVCNNDAFWHELYNRYYGNTNLAKYRKNYYEAFKFCTQLTHLYPFIYTKNEPVDIEKLYLRKNLIYWVYNNIIPIELGLLTNLTNLNIIDYNNINIIDIPKEIGNLKNLIYLAITGFTNLTNLHKLKTLILNKNGLIELPEQIGNLENLERLRIENNNITTLPKSMSKLHNLTHFTYTGNKIADVPGRVKKLLLTNNVKLKGKNIMK